MSGPLSDPTPAMRKLLARIRRRGESGLRVELAPFNTARALMNRDLVMRQWDIDGLYYYADPAEKTRKCSGCHRDVRALWNKCHGCKRIVCVRCAEKLGHGPGGEHR